MRLAGASRPFAFFLSPICRSIRRLKTRLRTPANHLCCIGTSATLGSVEATNPLIEYAQTVFSESFDRESVIGEDLLILGDIVDGYFIRYHSVAAAIVSVMR